MASNRITYRQKDIARVLREQKTQRRDKLLALKERNKSWQIKPQSPR